MGNSHRDTNNTQRDTANTQVQYQHPERYSEHSGTVFRETLRTLRYSIQRDTANTHVQCPEGHCEHSGTVSRRTLRTRRYSIQRDTANTQVQYLEGHCKHSSTVSRRTLRTLKYIIQKDTANTQVQYQQPERHCEHSGTVSTARETATFKETTVMRTDTTSTPTSRDGTTGRVEWKKCCRSSAVSVVPITHNCWSVYYGQISVLTHRCEACASCLRTHS